MDIGRIYLITNNKNSKVYVGKTIQDIHKRFWSHLSRWSNCRKLKQAIKELGKDSFKIVVIEDNIPYHLLNKREVYYINLYDSINNGYNIKEGNKITSRRNTHYITQSVKRRIVEDYKNGISPLNISKHFNLCTTSIYNILSENNIPRNYNKGGFNSKSKIDLNKLIELKSKGYKTTYISEYFNVNKSSVKRFINRHKNIIIPRVSDILASKVEDENVL